ncbi:Transmembrane protein 161A [Tupaia chinensis]|uniref:Transmembrane protein 161A n=1 Tax=Tupaia chinensis TaxID=246437 RepID=L9KXC5_TUPCH|nr:Transmembrane protein 161A [Tupaia chinensis]
MPYLSQAVLGVQLVVTLLTATLMHRLAPHCSFARWLLCNGRWANGLSDEKPLSVPRDAPFQLETCPLTTVDALVLHFFLEYQWFVDFAVYSGGVYLFTEAYYYVLGPAKETNIAVCWCLVTVAFSIAEEGGERSVCLTFAFLFLLLAMLVQVVREETLELGLEPGLASMTQNLEPLLKKQGWDWALSLVKLTIRVGLAVVGSMLGAFLTFPGLRLAQTHPKARVEQLRREAGRIEAREIQRRVVRVYCYVTVVSLQYLTPLILTLNCTLLLKSLGEQLQAGHHQEHRLGGGYSWGLGPVPQTSAVESSASTVLSSPGEDEVQQTAAQIAGALGGLLTPLFLRGVLAYLMWWTAACQLLSSLFGLYFHQQLAGS